MKKFLIIIIVSGVYLIGNLPSIAATEKTEKDIVRQSFRNWENGKGSPFDLLKDDASWTILGPTPSAGIYTIPKLRKEVLEPFQKRLSTPLKPTLREIYQDGNTVIILFEAKAMLKTGEEYANSYAWFFTMDEGRVQQVVAVLDLNAFEKVMATPLLGNLGVTIKKANNEGS